MVGGRGALRIPELNLSEEISAQEKMVDVQVSFPEASISTKSCNLPGEMGLCM